MSTIIFLCTGNYYRSRFAEYYFNHFSDALPWRAESRGLALDTYNNIGPISALTTTELKKLGIVVTNPRFPISATEKDFESAQKIIALNKVEHEPIINKNFPKWEGSVTYWEVGDIDTMLTGTAVHKMEKLLNELLESLKRDNLVKNPTFR